MGCWCRNCKYTIGCDRLIGIHGELCCRCLGLPDLCGSCVRVNELLAQMAANRARARREAGKR